MEEIAYDITAHYPLPPRNVEWGEVSSSPVFRHPDVRIQSQCLKEGREKWGGIHGSREGLQKCLAETTLRAYPLLVPNHQSCPDHETTPPPSLCTLDCQQILPHFLRSSTHHVPLSFCLLFLPVSLTALVSEIITTKDHFSVLLHQSPLGLPSFYGFSRRLPTFQYTGHWHSPCQRYWAVVIKWGRGIDLLRPFPISSDLPLWHQFWLCSRLCLMPLHAAALQIIEQTISFQDRVCLLICAFSKYWSLPRCVPVIHLGKNTAPFLQRMFILFRVGGEREREGESERRERGERERRKKRGGGEGGRPRKAKNKTKW